MIAQPKVAALLQRLGLHSAELRRLASLPQADLSDSLGDLEWFAQTIAGHGSPAG